MKKNYLLIFLLLIVCRVSGQNCNFSYQTNPGTSLVYFTPNSAFSPNLFTFVWNFGDGTVDSVPTPTHAYNSVGPFQACYDIYDSMNVLICSACDSIFLGSSFHCAFTYIDSGNTFIFTAAGTPTGTISWDFGDGNTGTGISVLHTYANTGAYSVIMTETDSNGVVLCQSGQGVNVGSSGTCSFSPSVAGDILTVFASNVSPNTLVSWDFGDGSTGIGYQATHQYSASGTYMVCMSAVDFNGLACQTCLPVVISVSPGNCYITSIPDSIDPFTYHFFASPAYPGSFIEWNFGDGSPVVPGTWTSHTFPTTGTFNVCITEYDSTGAQLCQSCQLIPIYNTPICNFTYAIGAFNPLTVDFQANGASTITWDFGDGTTGTGSFVNHTYAIGGIYQVCITSGTPGTPNYCQYCDFVAVGNSQNYCAINYYPDPFSPNTFVFSSSQSSPSSMIMWDFGDGTIGTGQSLSHYYAFAGIYTVCIVERDSAQNILCQNCITIQVSGGGGPASCQSSFIATSFGLDGFFIDMSVATNPLTTYTWDFGDGNTSNLQFPQHTYATPGLYNVCLTISDSMCTDIFCSPLLIDTGVFNPGNGCNAFYAFVQMAPYQVTVVNLSSGVNLSYDWDFGDGSPHDNNAYPSHVYSSTGSYYLCLTVSDANGCSSSYCDTLNVDTLGNIYRMATPGFTLNVLSPAMVTGVNEVAQEKTFGVYPNPFTSELKVSVLASNKKANDYRIFSVQGAEILRGKIEGTNGTINTQSLSTGVYLLEVTMTDGTRSFQRVIKN